ncbi:MAG: ribosome small subunit-dependent GTPase A [Ruminococcus sp.]|nr:ribosome small subunit-dependent GTPase A [Ruminococcus sp.]
MKESKTDGLIIKAISGFYYVEVADKIYECKARGAFRRDKSAPLVGDLVTISLSQKGYPVIDKIHPRKNFLVRPPMANIDNIVIVCSTVSPSPNYTVIDKMISTAVYNDMEPVIVISKSDICPGDELFDIYQKTGMRTIIYSAVTGEGIDEIYSILPNKITAFIGNSGVGKSTLLNKLFPDFNLKTGEISEKLGRGRHTTRTVELFKTMDGYVCDTPGFSTVQLERFNIIDKDSLQYSFPEFQDYIGNCKFTSCSHTCEKGCAVIEGVKQGEIPVSRHNSYVEMYNEIKDIKEWERKK